MGLGVYLGRIGVVVGWWAVIFGGNFLWGRGFRPPSSYVI